MDVTSDFFAALQEQQTQAHRNDSQNEHSRQPGCKTHRTLPLLDNYVRLRGRSFSIAGPRDPARSALAKRAPRRSASERDRTEVLRNRTQSRHRQEEERPNDYDRSK
jgi:hypothetical protein